MTKTLHIFIATFYIKNSIILDTITIFDRVELL